MILVMVAVRIMIRCAKADSFEWPCKAAQVCRALSFGCHPLIVHLPGSGFVLSSRSAGCASKRGHSFGTELTEVNGENKSKEKEITLLVKNVYQVYG